MNIGTHVFVVVLDDAPVDDPAEYAALLERAKVQGWGVPDQVDRTDHLPFCTASAGGDCDCGPVPSEVWCERGVEESSFEIETTTGTHALCRKHALDLLWKLGQRGAEVGS